MSVERFGFVFRDDSAVSQAVAERDLRALSPSYTRSYGLVATHGSGARLWDEEENEYIDFAAGIAVLSTGFGHPRVVEAIQHQSAAMVHLGGTDFFYRAQVEIAEYLQRIVPIKNANTPEDKLVYLGNSGTESIEAALKLARYKGGNNGKRKEIIAFYGSFHGRTYGALSLTASKAVQRAEYPYIPGGVVHVPYPSKFAYTRSAHKESIEFNPVRYIRDYVFKKARPDEIAAVVVEAIQGEGGYVVPTDSFLPELRALCDEYGILMICDEIQAGIGRTGKWFAFEHWGIQPDIVCTAKGLGSGMPIGAIIAHKDVMSRWIPGAHASTFGGNLVSCRAAVATLQVIETENLMDNARTVGDFALRRLAELQAQFPVIKRAEGIGLMIGVEFADADGKPIPKFRDEVVDQCFLEGLVTLACGTSTIRICPALVITEAEMAQGLEIFAGAIAKALAKTSESEAPHLTSPTRRALIIDDEPEYQTIARRVIQEFDQETQIELAENYEEAARMLDIHSQRYDFVILDSSLTEDATDRKGLDLLRTLRTHRTANGTVIIVYSATLSIADYRALIEEGIIHTLIAKDEAQATDHLLDALGRFLGQAAPVAVK